MKSKLFSGIKQFWQLNIYKRHFLSQEETEAARTSVSLWCYTTSKYATFIFAHLDLKPDNPHQSQQAHYCIDIN